MGQAVDGGKDLRKNIFYFRMEVVQLGGLSGC